MGKRGWSHFPQNIHDSHPSTSLRTGVQLIELLVVITIIVLLLALLTPALDKAIEKAELAVCASRLDAIGTGTAVYALDSKRFYPHRPGVHDTSGRGFKPNLLQLYNSPYKIPLSP